MSASSTNFSGKLLLRYGNHSDSSPVLILNSRASWLKFRGEARKNFRAEYDTNNNDNNVPSVAAEKAHVLKLISPCTRFTLD